MYKHLSGINAPLLERERDSVDREHVGGNPVIHFMSFRVAHNFVETAFKNILQAVVDFFLAPEKSLAILHPLEVTHCDAAGVRGEECPE